MKRIAMWSGPRNISTAMMYSFAQREDTTVVDEPLYGHYLRVTDADHPGKDEVIASMETDGDKVIEKIIFGEYDTPNVFFKMMTHHVVDISSEFLAGLDNIFLIRNPAQIICSLELVINTVTPRDVGIRQQFDLFRMLVDSGRLPAVVDSSQVLKNPESALSKLCIQIGIPFDKRMLTWDKGGIKEDGVWAKHWYANVRNTTGFQQDVTAERVLHEKYRDLYEESMAYYNELLAHSIRV